MAFNVFNQLGRVYLVYATRLINEILRARYLVESYYHNPMEIQQIFWHRLKEIKILLVLVSMKSIVTLVNVWENSNSVDRQTLGFDSCFQFPQLFSCSQTSTSVTITPKAFFLFLNYNIILQYGPSWWFFLFFSHVWLAVFWWPTNIATRNQMCGTAALIL